MIFRATGRIAVSEAAGVGWHNPASLPVTSPHEPVCRACEWFRADTERCYRVCRMCPADERRRKPWDRMPRCPEGKWVR